MRDIYLGFFNHLANLFFWLIIFYFIVVFFPVGRFLGKIRWS